MDITPLLRPHPPWLFWNVTDDAETLTASLHASGHRWRSLRGPAMRTTQEMFAEFKLALRFPEYFGQNWDALEDCLRDFAWWPAPSYILVLTNASEVLAAEPPSELRLLLRIVRAVGDQWAQPELLPDGTQRPAIPFHLVFQVHPRDYQKLLTRVTALDAAVGFGRLLAS
jgi:hypothetical protein